MIRSILLLLLSTALFGGNIYITNTLKRIEIRADGSVMIQDVPMRGNQILIDTRWIDLAQVKPCQTKLLPRKWGGIEFQGRVIRVESRKIDSVSQVFENGEFIVVFCSTSELRKAAIPQGPFSATGDIVVFSRKRGQVRHYTLSPSAPVLAMCTNE